MPNLPNLVTVAREVARLVAEEDNIRQDYPGAMEAVYQNVLDHDIPNGGQLNENPTPLELFAYVHANNRFEVRPALSDVDGDEAGDHEVLVCHAHYKNTVSSYMVFTWNPVAKDWEE